MTGTAVLTLAIDNTRPDALTLGDSAPYPFVEIEWEDAMSLDEWVRPDKMPHPPLVVTRGWLVQETERYLVLAGTYGIDPHLEFGEVRVLPKGMIVKVRQLEGRFA